jgi:hypothetical protein
MISRKYIARVLCTCASEAYTIQRAVRADVRVCDLGVRMQTWGQKPCSSLMVHQILHVGIIEGDETMTEV